MSPAWQQSLTLMAILGSAAGVSILLVVIHDAIERWWGK